MNSFRPIRNALVSVSNKQGLTDLATFLFDNNINIFSTGGTYKHILNSTNSTNSTLTQVSNLTEFPEILDGRVKTLHPKIYGGILARRNNELDIQSLSTHNIPPIDLVVVNLYPFKETVENQNSTEDEIIEKIDIGGPSMLRAAAKNFKDVVILTSPNQYTTFQSQYTEHTLTLNIRKQFALQAFQHVTDYDISIANYFSDSTNLIGQTNQTNQTSQTSQTKRLYKSYNYITDLKYGLNPNQKDAKLYYPSEASTKPFNILNGSLGYINVLDAVNAYALVSEMQYYLDDDEKSVVASFKHTSPAGVAFSRALSTNELSVFNVSNNPEPLSSTASAFLLARNCDPKSSFGDFLAISSNVDVQTARLIKREVSDGIIAPSYDQEALDILKSKKAGKYIILQSTNQTANQFANKTNELRSFHNITLTQQVNNNPAFANFTNDNLVTEKRIDLSQHNAENSIKNNLILANITLKYTQSNSVAFSKNAQCVVAAGQQNRVDCTKLAGNKMRTLLLRFHPKVLNLLNLLKSNVSRQTEVNAVIQYLEQEFTAESYEQWRNLFTDPNNPPQPLTRHEIETYLTEQHSQPYTSTCLASDAFFPFEDNIDVAHQYGAKHIVQTGGSIRDDKVIERANDYGMSMILTGNRFFLH